MWERSLMVARCTSIINPNTPEAKYAVNFVGRLRKMIVKLDGRVSPTDIEEGMRVGVDRITWQIRMPLPPRHHRDASKSIIEEKPDITYNDIGGCKEQIQQIREIVELPMVAPEKFVRLGIEPPKGVLLYGPPGTGKTLVAKAVANRTDACFIRVNGTELVRKSPGQGAVMVRQLFKEARSKKGCIIFFDEVDAIGGARYFDGAGGDYEVQRTMLEIVNQLDGFDARGNVKVLMATNRPDTLDPALVRPGRMDRKVEFGLPDLEGRTQIFRIHTKNMSIKRGIRFELLARLCPNCTGADLRSVCNEAGMFAIRARRKIVTEKDFLDAVHKVISGYHKFSATPEYMLYN
ncbi:26S proteasome regulatory subunit 7-like isoform X2 [Spinacia oleracea]|nr:26S proteasome regulatory subunit 7-like isoform X2 [Spinacia oleracea]